MCVNSLEETKGDPDVDGEDMQVTAEHAVEDGSQDGAGAEDEDFRRMRILGSETERRGILVVNLVNMFVQRAPVQCLVSYMLL